MIFAFDQFYSTGYKAIKGAFLFQRLTFLNTLIEYVIVKPKWRNWQTRYVQGVVSITLVRVQIPPSALKNPQYLRVFILLATAE